MKTPLRVPLSLFLCALILASTPFVALSMQTHVMPPRGNVPMIGVPEVDIMSHSIDWVARRTAGVLASLVVYLEGHP